MDFWIACDRLNPMYILDCETLTLLWISLLHDKARIYTNKWESFNHALVSKAETEVSHL